ncbi:MAG: ABC transporter ATP-binding protein [Pseudonocardia sp.]
MGGRELLHIEALEVPSASTLAVLGPNGAGKSTLLRALGLLSPHHVSGTVALDGTPVTARQMRTAVAAVLQRPILRRGTVADNAASGLRFRGVNRREARNQTTPWLEALGIAHLADRDARTLSGGEAQRLSIARALAIAPRVLLLDEPFTGLDTTTRADLIADLRAALDQQATAAVLVTHDRREALALADHTALLIGGRIRQYGQTASVLDNPTDRATAQLLGFTNLLPPRLTGRTHTLAARPEHCQVIHDPSAADALTITGNVRRIIPLGAVTRLDIDTTDGTITCLTPGDPDIPTGTPANRDVTVRVSETRTLRNSPPRLGSPQRTPTTRIQRLRTRAAAPNPEPPRY